MVARFEPKKIVRVIFPDGSVVTVSEEQALRCRYRLADSDEPAKTKTPTRRQGRKPAETPVVEESKTEE